MPEPIVIACVVSILLALSALSVAVKHAIRFEKRVHCSREHPCHKGKPPS
jgi:hypothetical protein